MRAFVPKTLFLIAMALMPVSQPAPATACIWDSDSLADERRAHPKLAEAILNPAAPEPDPAPLRKRIRDLQANRREQDPDWWNDLAGAHLRLGEAAEAVRLLEPLRERFGTNYGIHANLGTAYHLLGRYQEAEREIARDLEINPEAHFGLEKYHLALLQYLTRDADYRFRHVYVDEFTVDFLTGSIRAYPSSTCCSGQDVDGTNTTIRIQWEKEWAAIRPTVNWTNYDARQLLRNLAQSDASPGYCTNRLFAAHSKLEEGVIYMATLNPKEPACLVMLGMRALQERDLNLAMHAFQRAIDLGSPQRTLLAAHIDSLQDHIREARSHRPVTFIASVLVAVPSALLGMWALRRWRRERKASALSGCD